MAHSILVVDDDPSILRGVSALLEQAGYSVRCASSGEQAIDTLVANYSPDLVVLDVVMPNADGFEVCRHIRQLPTHIPVLMLSARDEVIDKVFGLEVGADDYITKPFEPRELIARIHALLRFKQRVSGSDDSNARIVFGPVVMSSIDRRFEVSGHQVSLSPKEWALLELFLKNPDRVFGRETLLRQVWGYDFVGDSRTVDVHIQRLRAKLKDYGAETLIQTVRGFGYRLASLSEPLTPT
jgi:DNA-binding response OmpR family regulator